MESSGREADGETTEQVGALVRRRLLRTHYEWGLVLVQPAIVSAVTTSVGTKKASAQIASASPLNELAKQAAGDTAII